MSERINNLLFQVLSRLISTKVFWTALVALLVFSAKGVWYASATYTKTEDLAAKLAVIEVELKRMRDFEHRLIRLEVKAGIASKPISETAEATN